MLAIALFDDVVLLIFISADTVPPIFCNSVAFYSVLFVLLLFILDYHFCLCFFRVIIYV